MRPGRILISIIMSSLALSATADSYDIQQLWNDNGAFSNAVRPGAGFSFNYDGMTFGPEFSSDWHPITTRDGNSSRTTLTHTKGLVVTRDTRVLPDVEAIEYRIRFKNVSEKPLSAVSAIEALDISFRESVIDGNCVVSSGGGLLDAFLPPRSFTIRNTCFSSISEYPEVIELTTKGGRSSSKDLPFFLIHNDTKQEGMFVALGWSGQWEAAAVRDQQARALKVRGKVPDLEIALQPGEEIQGPTVLIGLYKGKVVDGSNQLRRVIRDFYTPRLSGKPPLPIATYDTWFGGIGMTFDETLLRKLADVAASIGQEYFLLDAGWYRGGWDLGNWYEVDKSKLPHGLQPIADDIRARGMKLGLWFEPERVAEDSQLAKEHPEWILWDYGDAAAPWTSFIPWINYLDQASNPKPTKRYGLLDYGQPAAQKWVRELLDYYIRKYDLRYIRYDFNLEPLAYWRAHDKAGRRGITQVKHIQGFYAVIDWLRERHPHVVLEGCASGGQRIDLETARRFHTFWISDHTADPSILRYHLFGVNYFLPGNYHYIQYTQPVPDQRDFKPDDLGFQSLFAGAFGTGGRIDLWPEGMREMARRHVSVHKTLRRYLIEDYYPLTDQPADLKSWVGWQFHDPVDQSGFIQTFRTKTPEAKHRFVIHNLEKQSHYLLSDAYSAEKSEVTGLTAMSEGIEVTQEAMSSRVFTYKKIPKSQTTQIASPDTSTAHP